MIIPLSSPSGEETPPRFAGAFFICFSRNDLPPLPHMPAAIDDERLPGDKVRASG